MNATMTLRLKARYTMMRNDLQKRYRVVQVMANGLTVVRDYACGVTGCYDSMTLAYVHGSLRLQ